MISVATITESRLVGCVFACFLVACAWAQGQKAQASASPSKIAYEKGLAALHKADLPSARSNLEKAIQLSPSNAEAHEWLGWVLGRQGDLDSAVRELRAAVKLKPGLADAHVTLASILIQQGNPAEAENEARAAVKAAPTNAEAHRILGRTLSLMNLKDEGVSELRQAVKLAPQRCAGQMRRDHWSPR